MLGARGAGRGCHCRKVNLAVGCWKTGKSVCLSVCLFLSAVLLVYLYVLSIYVPVCLHVFYVCFFVSASLSFCLFVHLSVRLFIRSSVCPIKNNRQKIYCNFQYFVPKVFSTFSEFIKTLT